jgi:hypothetical protein
VTPALTYTLRCNTDVTSLLSGTSIKAVVAYISDYITKQSLKIYHMFDTVKNVINKQTDSLGGSATSKKNTRKLIMQMVNSLTSKLQIGSPMASLYLLENPDHYTNLNFKVFWWKSYVSEVAKLWHTKPFDEPDKITKSAQVGESESSEDESGEDDRLVLLRAEGQYVGATNVDDYIHRPPSFETTSLYEFFQMTSRKKRTEKQKQDFVTSLAEAPSGGVNFELATEPTPDDDDWLDNDLEEVAQDEAIGNKSDAVSIHAFQPGHELYKTHYIRCDRRDLEKVAPNFVGGALPRMDQGDRE